MFNFFEKFGARPNRAEKIETPIENDRQECYEEHEKEIDEICLEVARELANCRLPEELPKKFYRNSEILAEEFHMDVIDLINFLNMNKDKIIHDKIGVFPYVASRNFYIPDSEQIYKSEAVLGLERDIPEKKRIKSGPQYIENEYYLTPKEQKLENESEETSYDKLRRDFIVMASRKAYEHKLVSHVIKNGGTWLH